MGFDDDPSGGVKRLRLSEGLIVNAKNEYNARAQDTILTGSFILPTEEPAALGVGQRFAWQRQYAMHLEKTTEARGNYLLFVDEERGVVTYKELAPQKVRRTSRAPRKSAFKAHAWATEHTPLFPPLGHSWSFAAARRRPKSARRRRTGTLCSGGSSPPRRGSSAQPSTR